MVAFYAVIKHRAQTTAKFTRFNTGAINSGSGMHVLFISRSRRLRGSTVEFRVGDVPTRDGHSSLHASLSCDTGALLRHPGGYVDSDGH